MTIDSPEERAELRRLAEVEAWSVAGFLWGVLIVAVYALATWARWEDPG